MENYVYLIKELDINKKFLQSKKDQTLYKIKYIVEYVKNWLFVFCKRKDIKNINFIYPSRKHCKCRIFKGKW